MARKGLGRGLSALIASQQETSEGIEDIAISSIVPNPDQPRRHIEEQGIEELALSIREHGLIQPIVVQPLPDGRYQLIAGERRWRAAQKAGLVTVPAIVRQVSEEQRLEIALVENVQREDINPVEQALAYRTLMERYGMTQEEVAQKVGKSRTAIANTLRLLSLDAEILQGVQEGKISEGHARALLMAPEEARLAMYRQAVAEGWSVRQTERAARQIANRADISPSLPEVSRETASDDPNLSALEDRLRNALATKVQIRSSNGAGVIEIHFYSPEDLTRIVEQIAL